ncbi:MAG TPA: hypothetical protein VN083_06900 [Vicinamibacteria bacterium]|nr:hypothetical protein [Vicinamibacteria bacterium]
MTPPELPSWLCFLPGDLELFRANGGAEGLEAKGLRAYVALLPKDVLEGLEALRWRFVQTGRLTECSSVAGVLRATLATLLQLEGLPVPKASPETPEACTGGLSLPKELVERLEALRKHYVEIGRMPPEADLASVLRGSLLVFLEERGFPVEKKPRMRLV